MQKIIATLISFLMLSSLGFAAENAKNLMKEVDKRFSAATKYSVYTNKKKLKVDEIDQIKELRKNAESFLKSGNEEEAHKLLEEALKILK